MIDRLNRPESHRNGRKLPEIGHQPGVGIGAKSSAIFQFAAEILQLFFGKAAFQIGARVHAWGGVALVINYVAIAVVSLSTKKVIERNLV